MGIHKLISLFNSTVVRCLLAGLLLVSCKNDTMPKPRGFFRIDFPAKEYHTSNLSCPFGFVYPVYCMLNADTLENAEPCWYDIYFAPFDANIHLSYKPVSKNLSQFTEDARKLAYKHAIKAQAISEEVISRPEARVFGLKYIIEGNTASSYQFYLTDSNRHFIRGALYFNTRTQMDSLRPVVQFITTDIDTFIQSFVWK